MDINRENDGFDIYFEEEHIALRETVRNFVKKELPSDYVREMDQNPDIRFPFEIRDKLRQLELTRVGIPEEYGGLPMCYRSLYIAMEELAKGTPAAGFVSGVMGQWGGVPISQLGTKEQKEFYLPRIAAGELLFALAMTEASGGSDLLANKTTTAREDGDDFIITGEKIFITAAHVADYIMVLALTDPKAESRSQRYSLIIVDPKTTPGIEITPIKKVIIRSVGCNIVAFNDVRVPKKNLLGKRGEGYTSLLSMLTGHKLLCAAEAVGIAQAAYKEAYEYCQVREAFGRIIGRFQLIQKYLVDMETEISAARHLGYYAAYLADQGKDYMKEAIIAERYSSEIGYKTTSNAMSIFGGYGLTQDYNVERYWRDSRQFITTPFTNEIAVEQIAKAIGFPRFPN